MEVVARDFGRHQSEGRTLLNGLPLWAITATGVASGHVRAASQYPVGASTSPTAIHPKEGLHTARHQNLLCKLFTDQLPHHQESCLLGTPVPDTEPWALSIKNSLLQPPRTYANRSRLRVVVQRLTGPAFKRLALGSILLSLKADSESLLQPG